MKRMLLKFADQVLSREELKAVRGASGSCGQCITDVGPIPCGGAIQFCMCPKGPRFKCH